MQLSDGDLSYLFDMLRCCADVIEFTSTITCEQFEDDKMCSQSAMRETCRLGRIGSPGVEPQNADADTALRSTWVRLYDWSYENARANRRVELFSVAGRRLGGRGPVRVGALQNGTARLARLKRMAPVWPSRRCLPGTPAPPSRSVSDRSGKPAAASGGEDLQRRARPERQRGARPNAESDPKMVLNPASPYPCLKAASNATSDRVMSSRFTSAAASGAPC